MALSKSQAGYVDPYFDVSPQTIQTYAKVVAFEYDEMEETFTIRVGLWANEDARIAGKSPIRILEKRIDAEANTRKAVVDPITQEVISPDHTVPSFSEIIADDDVSAAMDEAKTVIYNLLKQYSLEFDGATDV